MTQRRNLGGCGALGIFLAIVIAGCSTSSEPSEVTRSTGEALSTVCGAPANGAVQGVDISHFQGNYNWAAAKAGGIAFGYASIGDGVGFDDGMFATNWANMGAAGVFRGAYQFFEPGQDPVAQANLMVAKVGRLGAGDLPCMIDVESNGGQSRATIAANVRTWLQIVQAGTGKAPTIYTGPYFWESSVGDTGFGGVPLWIADYGPSCPMIPNGWSNWVIWQYSDGGGNLDHDVFNGTLTDLQNFAGMPACTAHCQDATTIINSDCGSGNCGVFGAGCVDDSLGARCVFSACPAVGSKNICMPDGHTIGTCTNGALAQGDCAVFGSTCVDDSLGARCVFSECPAKGTKSFCQNAGTIATCNNGTISTGNCAAFGAGCVADSLGARCVFSACPAQGLKTICMPDGHTVGTCNDGAITFGDCAVFGSTCVADTLPARCVFNACPADGDKTTCVDGHTLGTCHNGAIRFDDCATAGDTCATAGGDAYCSGPLAAKVVSKTSAAMPDPSGQADYTACAGQPVSVSFDVKDIGTLPWTDISDVTPGDDGKAVRLGTSDGSTRNFPDPFTATGRISLSASTNPSVSPSGGACSNMSGCSETVFTVSGNAPAQPGLYTTTWQLVDETRAWFGPVMAVSFNVGACSVGDAGAPSSEGGPSVADSGAGGSPSASGGCSASARPASSVDGETGLFTLAACLVFGCRRRRVRTNR